MLENEHTIPFETGVQDRHAANVLEAFAVGRWTADLQGSRKSLEETYSLGDLFAQMTKEQLLDTARMLSEEVEGAVIWGGDDAGKGARDWPGITALRSMKKDALSAYLASAYKRVIPILLLRLDIECLNRLYQLAEREDATLISLIPEQAEGSASDEGRINIVEQYGRLIINGLLVAKRMWKFWNSHFYGLFIPAEVRAFLRADGGGLIGEWMLLDIVDCYAQAASNLYGVVTMEELPRIFGRYEKQIAKTGAVRSEITVLDDLIASAKQEGDLDIFRNLTDKRKKISAELCGLAEKELMAHIQMSSKRHGDYGTLVMELDGKRTMVIVGAELIDRAADDEDLYANAQSLFYERKGKPRYFPAKYDVFMAYADGIVNDDVPAAKHLMRLSSWLVRNHRREIAEAIRRDIEAPAEAVFYRRYAGTDENSVGMAADEIAVRVYEDIICSTMHNFGHTTGLETLGQEYGIIMRGMAEVNEYLSLWNEINSNSRMFANNGHTPLEMRTNKPPLQGPVQLMFGPGMQGTAFPKAVQEAIASGELSGQFTVDAAEVKRASAKIGRNDPCPCGSGKKYKNCCGKYK